MPLDSLIGSRARPLRACPGLDRAARALAEFHALPLVSGRQRPVDAELHRFTLRADRIATVDPAVGRAATRLARVSCAPTAALPARTGTVRSDCKPSQFLLSGDRVHLLDLDHCGTSDQAVDVGTFLATLRQLEIGLHDRLPSGTTSFAVSGEQFLRAYLRSAGPGRDVARIRWQEAVALERKALRAFARAPRSPLAEPSSTRQSGASTTSRRQRDHGQRPEGAPPAPPRGPAPNRAAVPAVQGPERSTSSVCCSCPSRP